MPNFGALGGSGRRTRLVRVLEFKMGIELVLLKINELAEMLQDPFRMGMVSMQVFHWHLGAASL